ncbi:hypothetical protein ACFLTQ_03060 [Chloroflexota bacterium]
MDAIADVKVSNADISKDVISMELIAKLGTGRAACVYLVADSRDGALYAEKAFRVGNGLSQLVRDLAYIACFQAPFPYRTNENAVHAALFRRKVLHELTRFWFGEPLVADACYIRWDEEAKFYILGTEYINGLGPKFGQVNRHSLRHFLHNCSVRLCKKLFIRKQAKKLKDPPWEIEETVIALDRLKDRFRQAGFLGSEWQVEKGLSVPTSNLLRNGSNQWILVDVESAFPAVALPGYIWRAIKYGSFPLFDDIDFSVLRRYLADNHQELLTGLGKADTERLYYYADQLEYHTRAWKASEPAIFSHRHRIITDPKLRKHIRQGFAEHWQKSGRIKAERAKKLMNSELLFTGYMALSAIKSVFSGLATLARSLKRITWRISRVAAVSFRLIYSAFFNEAYLQKVSRSYVLKNIDHWQKYGRLTKTEADKLKQDVESPVAGEYIQDFVAHLGLQLVEPPIIGNVALIAAAVFLGCPQLLAALFISPVLRTIYTLYRRIKNRGKGIAYNHAFVVGALPKVGAFAYCVQMSSAYPDLSVFLTRFQAARFGRHFPLLGGENTRFEHFCVKTVDLLASLQYELGNLSNGLKSIISTVWHRTSPIVNREDG